MSVDDVFIFGLNIYMRFPFQKITKNHENSSQIAVYISSFLWYYIIYENGYIYVLLNVSAARKTEVRNYEEIFYIGVSDRGTSRQDMRPYIGRRA